MVLSGKSKRLVVSRSNLCTMKSACLDVVKEQSEWKGEGKGTIARYCELISYEYLFLYEVKYAAAVLNFYRELMLLLSQKF